ncbi:MAG: hypothetical protein HOB32_11845 [Nitrospina sp.]|jgi:hypothetical protein|nr:hypothetical protein [Nitrospina sp.]
MTKKLNTKLFSSGAEFLVLSKLLLAGIETYKAYENQEGYDLLSINAKKNLSVKIQVKSKNFRGDSSFYLNKDDKTKSDFYVFAQTNALKRVKGETVVIPDSEVSPNLYVVDLKTVEKNKRIDKKGTPYFLMSDIPKDMFNENWDDIKKLLKL